MKRKKSKRVNCYLCSVDDPNEEHFDSHKHGICLVHAVSLWELAKEHLIFEARGSSVVMRLEKRLKKNSGGNFPRARTKSATGKSNTVSLELSSGYEVIVDLPDAREGMEHLSRALIGAVFFPIAMKGQTAEDSYPKAGDAVSNEIAALIEGVDFQTAKTLLRGIIWGGFLKEIERQETRQNQAN